MTNKNEKPRTLSVEEKSIWKKVARTIAPRKSNKGSGSSKPLFSILEFENMMRLPVDRKGLKGKNKLTFVCIDEVTDPRNIGSLIRSASSFHIDGLIVKERQFPSDSKLMYKAASGCMEHINIFEVSNINSTLKNLREKNFWVYGFDARGERDFTGIKWEGKNVLLFGSEGFGMREHTGKYTDFFVKIDINKDVESLNISNSAAIVFHHLSYLKKILD